MTDKIVDIADEIYRYLESPTDISIPAIAFWLRANVGALNNLIGTSFSIDDTTFELSTSISVTEKVIFKSLFYIYYYDKQIRTNLGAAASSSILEVSSDGAMVRTTNKNEISKTWLQLRKETQLELDTVVNSYNFGSITPVSVDGQDTNEVVSNPTSNLYGRTL